jgi:polar amino acid transport system ATP-binding protein
MVESGAQLPVRNVSALVGADSTGSAPQTAGRIEAARRAHGFFYVTGHGVDPALLDRLEAASRRFFGLPPEDKLEIAIRPAHV